MTNETDNDLRATLRELNTVGLQLHRELIATTRRTYEQTHGQVANPYAMFALVTEDPAFAWLRPLSGLLVQVSDVIDQKTILPDEASFIRSEMARLVSPAEGEDTTFYDRVREARQLDPGLVTSHTHIRAVLGRLP